MKIALSRKQIDQLHSMIREYTDEETIELLVDDSSGIGLNVTAMVRYAAGTRTDSRDITDYDRW